MVYIGGHRGQGTGDRSQVTGDSNLVPLSPLPTNVPGKAGDKSHKNDTRSYKYPECQ
jgi:hypothetical protein